MRFLIHRGSLRRSTPRNGRRGAVMIIVMMVMASTLLVGLAGMVVSNTDMKITWNYKRSAQAFFAAESGVQRAIAELREDNSWLAGFSSTDQSNGSSYQVQVSTLTPQLLRLDSYGGAGSSRRHIEAIVNVDSAFDHAINLGGDLHISGKPRISNEGIRLNGNAYFDLDDGTPALNMYAPSTSSFTYVDGSETDPVSRVETPALDLNAAKLSDDDWALLAEKATGQHHYDTDGITGNRSTNVTFNDLNFSNVPADADGKRTIYVDGDVTLHGSISGVGTIIATGKIVGTGGFYSGSGTTISFIAKDDVLLNFDTNRQSELNGLTYTEGDYEMHGKIKYTGVVTAFGTATIQNPSEFTNNSDPNFWYTYSSAYNIVSDPIDILLWQEVID
ncbi:MAG: hypothetical protein KJ042_01770 [Deltaproteobacteria bacterium]|nr:hypothetical protein [Deltaproteobacteria bacterium]